MIIPAMKEKRPWIDKTWSRQKVGFYMPRHNKLAIEIPVDSSSDLLDLKNAPLERSVDKVKILTNGNEKMINISKNIFEYRATLKESPKENLEDIAKKYISKLSEKELLVLYFGELNKQLNGKKAAVARAADISPQAIKNRYKKHIDKN